MSRIKMSVEERFMSHVMREGECWEWRGEMTTGGGKFWVLRGRNELGRGKSMLAHRFAWEMWTGKKLKLSDVVERTCGNVRCCRKEHLRLKGMEKMDGGEVEKTIDAMLREIEKGVEKERKVKGFSSNIFENGMKRIGRGEYEKMVEKWGEPKWTGEVVTRIFIDYYFTFQPEKDVDVRGRKRVFRSGCVVEWWKF